MKPSAHQKRGHQEAIALPPRNQGLPRSSWWLIAPDRFYREAEEQQGRIRTSFRAQQGSVTTKFED